MAAFSKAFLDIDPFIFRIHISYTVPFIQMTLHLTLSKNILHKETAEKFQF